MRKRVSEYVRLGQEWSAGHQNRMIKVPATPAGLDALEELVAAGVTVNVTLIFSSRQYHLARDAVWRGAQRRKNLDDFKSVYSIFVSRLDVYTEKAVPQLSPAAQGMVGILNAKRIWADNQQYWSEHATPLRQEIVFASTGTKKPSDPPWKYVEAFAGSDIQTNPPATNEAVAKSGRRFHPANRSTAAAGHRRRDRPARRYGKARSDADGRGNRQVRQPAEGAVGDGGEEADGRQLTRWRSHR